MKSKFLDHAIEYVERGWKVFPLAERGKIPLTSHGLLDASADPNVIKAWWKKWPSANIGVPTGPGSFDALDVDGEQGQKTLAAIVESSAKGWAHSGPWQETSAGGAHFFFAGGGLPTTARRIPGIDTRGKGGYVVIAPSIHPSGFIYRTVDLHLPLGPCPTWLLAAIGGGVSGTAAGPVPVPVAPERIEVADDTARLLLQMADIPLEAIPDGQRNDKLFRVGCSLRGRGMDLQGIVNILSVANRVLCQPPTSDNEVEKLAASAVRYAVRPEYQAAAAAVRVAEAKIAEVTERKGEAITAAEEREARALESAGRMRAKAKDAADALASVASLGIEAESDNVETLRQLLAREAGIVVQRIVQVGVDNPTYYFELEGDSAPVHIGTTITLQRSVGEALVRHRRLPGISLLPPKRWPAIVRVLMQLVEVENPSESRRGEETRIWLKGLIDQEREHRSLRRDFEAVNAKRAFLDGPWIYFSAVSVLRGLKVSMVTPVGFTLSDLIARLRELGAEPQGAISERSEDGRQATANYWKIHEDALRKKSES